MNVAGKMVLGAGGQSPSEKCGLAVFFVKRTTGHSLVVRSGYKAVVVMKHGLNCIWWMFHLGHLVRVILSTSAGYKAS